MKFHTVFLIATNTTQILKNDIATELRVEKNNNMAIIKLKNCKKNK